ncbi:hypothetical protein EGW08_015722 [Elysia chlorotica]|uniref:BESS domain-containing protein n=1 Tax=Elysia chlorotica TaxID=188477 RepID=A0A3S1B004_ELYCH|nr:hypothetical protein EGW08_015722 [Elysia chlorotica]
MCQQCVGKDRWAKVCRSSTTEGQKHHKVKNQHHEASGRFSNAKKMHEVELKDDNEELDLQISTITNVEERYEAMTKIQIDAPDVQKKKIFMKVKVDTGSAARLTGCINVADDIVVFGKTEADHNENMKELQRRCRERNIILNEEKACLKKTEIDFLGHTIGKDGVKPYTKTLWPQENPLALYVAFYTVTQAGDSMHILASAHSDSADRDGQIPDLNATDNTAGMASRATSPKPQPVQAPTPPNAQHTRGKKRKAEFNNCEKLLELEQQKIQLLEERSQSEDTNDDNLHFLKSVLPYINRIREEKMMRFRSRVQLFIDEFTFQDQMVTNPYHNDQYQQELPPPPTLPIYGSYQSGK